MKRIGSVLLCNKDSALHSLGFKEKLSLGPLNFAASYLEKLEVDEILLLSIDGSSEVNFLAVNELIQNAKMTPCSYGGGVTNRMQVKKLIQMGIDRVVLGPQILKKQEILEEYFDEFGLETFIIHIPLLRICDKNVYEVWANKLTIDEIQTRFLKLKEEKLFPEIMITDVKSSGFGNTHSVDFWHKIPSSILDWPNKIAYGGLYSQALFDPQAHERLVKQVNAVFLGSALFQGTCRVRNLKELFPAIYRPIESHKQQKGRE
jgi:phosphoribosylformimino-5-aminoimidazole carboxamide ribonucleotide (ProFAR) isomerase